MCGDSFNPGAIALLKRLTLSGWIQAAGHRIEGWLVTGPHGVRVEGRYPKHLYGLAVTRRDLDDWLVREAIRAGVTFEDGVVATQAIIEWPKNGTGGPRVGGILVQSKSGSPLPLTARITIAADGRRSTLAFGLGLSAHPARPRRWAIGGHFEHVTGQTALGEMHIGRRDYFGVASLPRGLTNVCLVTPTEDFAGVHDPASVLRGVIDRDEELRERFAHARMVSRGGFERGGS